VGRPLPGVVRRAEDDLQHGWQRNRESSA
jgi:hypothetical protein